jgi:urease accessory protein
MLEAHSLAAPNTPANAELVASFAERQKSRHKTQTTDGEPLGWFLPRGQVLQDGDKLLCSNGLCVAIKAAAESVSQVHSSNPHLLTRAAYHLGNRHVPLQIGEGFLRYLSDHVLDDMLQGLGLQVERQTLPFQPENGAYHQKSLLLLHNHSHHP